MIRRTRWQLALIAAIAAVLTLPVSALAIPPDDPQNPGECASPTSLQLRVTLNLVGVAVAGSHVGIDATNARLTGSRPALVASQPERRPAPRRGHCAPGKCADRAVCLDGNLRQGAQAPDQLCQNEQAKKLKRLMTQLRSFVHSLRYLRGEVRPVLMLLQAAVPGPLFKRDFPPSLYRVTRRR